MSAAAPKRQDPKPRHIDGISVWANVRGKDPTRVYVLANKTGIMGADWYQMLGYKIETADYTAAGQAKGVYLAGGKTARQGEPLEMMGLVLMSISKEKHDLIERHGIDGQSGQAEADEIEARIIDKEAGGTDEMRGMRSRRGVQYFRGVNETTAPEVEGA